MALDRWLLVAALAIAHGGCDDSERRAEAHASFAAYRACLTGGPLAEGETFSRRMRRVGLAFPEPSQEWPARCEALGDEAYRATKDEPVLRAALVGYASGMRHDDDAWAEADRLVTVDADSSVERPPAPIQPIEAEEWPVLASSGFGNHGVEVPPTLGALPARVVLEDRELLACEVEAAGEGARARCRAIEDPPDDNVYLADGEPGAPFLLSAGHVSFTDAGGAVRQVGSETPGRGHTTRDGTLYLVQRMATSPVLVTIRGDERDTRPIEGAGNAYHRVQIRDGRLLFATDDREGARLLAYPLAPDGPVEGRPLGELPLGLRIGAAARCPWGRALATWDQPDHARDEVERRVRLFLERGEGAAAQVATVDTRIAKPPSRSHLVFFRLHGAAPALSCTDEGVILSVFHEGLLHWQRCTANGCEAHRTEIPRGGRAVFVGDHVLIVRRDRGLRIRFGPPESIASVEERVVADPRLARGTAIQPLRDGAVLWVFDREAVRALRVDASGGLTPIAPAD